LPKEQINKLLKLQEVDLEIIALESEKKELPETLEETRQQENLLNEQVRAVEQEMKEIQVEHKKKELELSSKEDEIKKHNAKLYQIKSNKEYSSLQSEIKGIEADCSVLEDEIITLLDKVDSVSERMKKEKERQEEKLKIYKEKESSINNRMGLIDKEIEALKEKREQISLNIDKAMRLKYEKVLNGKKGVVLVPVVDQGCGGCHMELPPQVIDDLIVSDKLIFCENCARILYLPEEAKDE